MSVRTFQAQYEDQIGRLHRVREAMVDQLTVMVADSRLTLGVPIESRVKTWDSIDGKLQRKGITPSAALAQLDDLVGLRVIFLFQEDVGKFRESLLSAFEVFSVEDVADRLGDAEFGYQSHHYVVAMPSAWKDVPTLAQLVGQKVEIQVRTLAQHIWAAASHKLQYKRESSVPAPIRRTINRVSALLETVDLELSRVLEERETYVRDTTQAVDGPLDVTTVEAVLDSVFPLKNKDTFEDYADLLDDLRHLGVHSRERLLELLRTHAAATLEAEAHEVETRDFHPPEPDRKGESERERLARGVFFTHVGLARHALQEEFGEAALYDCQDRKYLLNQPKVEDF